MIAKTSEMTRQGCPLGAQAEFGQFHGLIVADEANTRCVEAVYGWILGSQQVDFLDPNTTREGARSGRSANRSFEDLGDIDRPARRHGESVSGTGIEDVRHGDSGTGTVLAGFPDRVPVDDVIAIEPCRGFAEDPHVSGLKGLGTPVAGHVDQFAADEIPLFDHPRDEGSICVRECNAELEGFVERRDGQLLGDRVIAVPQDQSVTRIEYEKGMPAKGREVAGF